MARHPALDGRWLPRMEEGWPSDPREHPARHRRLSGRPGHLRAVDLRLDSARRERIHADPRTVRILESVVRGAKPYVRVRDGIRRQPQRGWLGPEANAPCSWIQRLTAQSAARAGPAGNT